MASGVFNFPRPFADGDLYMWVSVEQGPNGQPTALQIAQATAEAIGRTAEIEDLHVEQHEPYIEDSIEMEERPPTLVRVTYEIEAGAIDMKTIDDVRSNISRELGRDIPSRDIGVTTEAP